MRITNRIIQNNSLTNINNNKILQDNLSTQIATEKKISRPSEDPIIALRSLRLRTSVNQTDQFRTKNAEDAESWLEVTEDAINTLTDIVTDVRKQYVKGTSDTLKASDRQIILENLQSLAAEVYNTGNVDFAGRSLFTGYRTDTTLTYQKNENQQFKIWEDGSIDTMDKVDYTHRDDTVEQNVYRESVSRFRLSYKNLDAAKGTVVKIEGMGDVTPTVISSSANPDPFQTAIDNPDDIIYVPETGELLFGKNIAESIETGKRSFTVTYEKNEWTKGDLRPQHYFKCEDVTNYDPIAGTGSIEYNFTSSPEAEICYNIGVNQTLRINTNASECFTHNITRDIDDIVRAIKEVDSIEIKLKELTDEFKELPENDPRRDALQTQIDAVNKSYTYMQDTLSTMFGKGITKADGYLAKNSLALTNCGTRSKRLELIQNRLDTQLSTLKELKSENEDVDMAETAVKLSSANYAYDAALMATGKIMKESLLNYL